MRISDWSSDVCSSDLVDGRAFGSSDSRDISGSNILDLEAGDYRIVVDADGDATGPYSFRLLDIANAAAISVDTPVDGHNEGRKTDIYAFDVTAGRSEENTSELQSLMRISYAVFCLKKKKTAQTKN